MNKRILSVLLAALMILSTLTILPITASAGGMTVVDVLNTYPTAFPTGGETAPDNAWVSDTGHKMYIMEADDNLCVDNAETVVVSLGAEVLFGGENKYAITVGDASLTFNMVSDVVTGIVILGTGSIDGTYTAPPPVRDLTVTNALGSAATPDTDYAWNADKLIIKANNLTVSGTTSKEYVEVAAGVTSLTIKDLSAKVTDQNALTFLDDSSLCTLTVQGFNILSGDIAVSFAGDGKVTGNGNLTATASSSSLGSAGVSALGALTLSCPGMIQAEGVYAGLYGANGITVSDGTGTILAYAHPGSSITGASLTLGSCCQMTGSATFKDAMDNLTGTVVFDGEEHRYALVGDSRAKSVLIKGAFDPDEGTAEAPYEIGTLAQLEALADAVMSGNNFAGKYVVLTADIGTAEAPFTQMIGSDDKPFNGTFDGAGHTVTVDITSGSFNVGFIIILRGTVKNMILKGSVTATASRITAGSLAAQNLGTVINCASFASMTASIVEYGVGGLVGYTANGARTVNCYYGGTLTGPGYDGICMSVYGNVSHCFYDSELSPSSKAKTNSAGLSTAQMKAAAGAVLETGVADNKSLVDLLNEYNDTAIGSYKWVIGESGYPEIVPCFTITDATADEHGTIGFNAVKALAGETVTITANPAEGFAIATLIYNDGEDHEIVAGEGGYTFVMPAQNVTVTATFDVAHVHAGDLRKGRAATDTAAGWNDYYECDCGVFFADADCTTLIGDAEALEAWKTGAGAIPARGHDFGADHRCTRCHDMDPQYQLTKDAALALIRGVYELDNGTFDFASADEIVRKDGEPLYSVNELKFFRVDNVIYVIHGGDSHVKKATFTLDGDDNVISVTTHDTMTEEVNGTYTAGKGGANLTWLWILLGILGLLIVLYVVLFFIWKKDEKLPDALAFLGFLEPSYKAINNALFKKKEENNDQK